MHHDPKSFDLRRSFAIKQIFERGGLVYCPELCNISSLSIGNKARIHSHVWIGSKVTIGNGALIQAFAFIPDGVHIGNRVFIGPHVCFTNDKNPPSQVLEETYVENEVRIGANATILPGITLGRRCWIGAGAVVTKDVPAQEMWVGNPARKLRDRP